MLRIPVKSSDLKSVGYDASRKILEVEFKNGSIYFYTSVPPEIYAGLMQAPSHGHYFSEMIKKFPGRYHCTRIQ